MKKIFLIVAVLMLATPALAAVTVDVWAEAGSEANEIEIWYEVAPEPCCPSDGNRPRAFGLNISVDDGNIIDVNVPFEGECDDVNRGYGIFPGTIAISGGEVTNYGSSGYTPVAPGDDPGAEGTGLDTNTIVVEMGSLYEGANCPDPCALLFTFIVSRDCNVSIVGNAARTGEGSSARGVVLENLEDLLANFPETPFKVHGVSRYVPDVVGDEQSVAEAAIDACDLVVGDINWVCHPSIAYDYVISTDPEAGTKVDEGSSVDLVKSLGACDFGDANDPPYPTLLANNGARHLDTGVILGVLRDTEADGQPNATATGDDNDGTDDEDGITQLVITPVGGFVTVTVTADCNLNAWIDFNDNGDWDDPGEQIFTDESLLLAGSPHPLLFAVPAYAVRETDLVSRWRVNYAGGLTYTGRADDGEVEDHLAEVVCHVPDVVNEPNEAARQLLIDNGFTIGVVTAECNDTIPDGNVIRTDPNYCNYPGCDTDVNMVVSSGPCPACEVPNVIDMTLADANDALVAAGYVLGAVTESNDCGVVGDFNVISSDPCAGATPECGTPVDIVICECYYGQPDYAVWEAVGKPICWCYPRQCHGDADGEKQGGGPPGYRYVDSDDLDIMSLAWGVKEPPKGPGIISVPNGPCADFDHKKQGGGPPGYRYVDSDDLDIMSLYWAIKEPPKGPGVDPDCKPGNRTPAP